MYKSIFVEINRGFKRPRAFFSYTCVERGTRTWFQLQLSLTSVYENGPRGSILPISARADPSSEYIYMYIHIHISPPLSVPRYSRWIRYLVDGKRDGSQSNRMIDSEGDLAWGHEIKQNACMWKSSPPVFSPRQSGRIKRPAVYGRL